MFKVELLAQDLRQDEMIIQIVESVQKLELIFDQLVNTFDDKIKIFHSRIAEIDRASNVVQSKIDKLKETRSKVTKVFSNYKYPASSCHQAYKPLFNVNSNQSLHELKKVKINSSHLPFDEEILKEKIKFFNIQKESKIDETNCLYSSLGPIPWQRIHNIGSLILFNTSENPYIKSRQGLSLIDTKLKNRKILEPNENDDSITPITPSSLLNKEPTNEEVLRYNPNFQDAPQLFDQLPVALPHLPGIADDLLFNDDLFSNFSGSNCKLLNNDHISSVKTQNLSFLSKSLPPPPPLPQFPPPDIPSISTANLTFSSESSQNLSKSSNLTEIEYQKNISSTPIASPPPPPPPPPPPLPPPPPPPPLSPSVPPPSSSLLLPSTAMSSKSIENQNSKLDLSKMPSISNDRAGLLASIREAKGRPIKRTVTVKERKIEEKRKEKDVVQHDFMFDLQKKLNDRRKGMSGRSTDVQIQQSQKTGDNFLNKLVANISTKNKNHSSSEESNNSDNSDSDWDDK